jgi:DNA primase
MMITVTLNFGPLEIHHPIVDLEPLGAYLRGTCPNCNEKTFLVSPQTDRYYCFGCGISGIGKREK